MSDEPPTIEQTSLDQIGWASFSRDMKRRYRLSRWISDPPKVTTDPRAAQVKVAVFVMLNPSTADAFKPDRTVDKCVRFARHWGMDRIEVANLYAFRSTWPEDLDDVPAAELGIDSYADAEILAACGAPTPNNRIIASWGNHGWRHGRAAAVRKLLHDAGHTLLTFGLTKDGNPLHTLARGKLLIPIDREPVPWSYAP